MRETERHLINMQVLWEEGHCQPGMTSHLLAVADLPAHACVPSADQQELCFAQLRLLCSFDGSAARATAWGALHQQRMGRSA